MKNIILLVAFFFSIIVLVSCEYEFLGGSINSSPFKKNLTKDGGKWEVSREDFYYTDNNAKLPLGQEAPFVTGVMTFTEEDPEVNIAGNLGTWTPKNGTIEDILYQMSSPEYSIEFTVWKWENNSTTDHSGYSPHVDWDENQMTWTGHEYTHLPGDTLVKHWYHFKKL